MDLKETELAIDPTPETPNEFKGFKAWFKIMWQNFYIQIFVIAVAFFIGILTQIDGSFMFYVILAIPVLMMIVIGYKGFYQFWRDLQQGTSR